MLCCKKLSISFFLSSTVFPCSITMGQIPFWMKVKAENNPAGPAPIIIGEGPDCKERIEFTSNEVSIFLSMSNGSIFKILGYFVSSLTSMSIVY